jgi:hypothetical protein
MRISCEGLLLLYEVMVLGYQILDPKQIECDHHRMATSKRPKLRKQDRVSLSRIKRPIPAYGGKPFVGREDVQPLVCTGCGQPAHASETDDAGYHPRCAPSKHSTKKHLDNWLGHARIIHQAPTGRPVFAAHERDHHITTSGRRALDRAQFALPPGPEEKRRGIKGRLPIDTINRARNALQRASQMQKRGHITVGQLAEVRRMVHRAWPSIEVHTRVRASNGTGRVMVYPVTEKDPLGRARKDVLAGRKDHSTKAERFADLQRQGFMKRGPMRTWVVAVGSPSGDPGEDTYVEVQGKTEAAALRAAQVRKPGRRLTVRYAK